MSNLAKKNHLFDDQYVAVFNENLRKIQTGEVTVEMIKAELREMEAKIDQWAKDSEFFDLDQATTLLGWSEAILQDLDTYAPEVRNDLLAAIIYFVEEEDGIPDSNPLTGLDDDYEVMKAVLEVHDIKLL